MSSDLRQNFKLDREVLDLLATLFKVNSVIEEISLQGVGITKDSAIHMSGFLSFKKIKQLFLKCSFGQKKNLCLAMTR